MFQKPNNTKRLFSAKDKSQRDRLLVTKIAHVTFCTLYDYYLIKKCKDQVEILIT